MTQMISLQRLSPYKQDEMKEGFLLALRHHMELNHRQLRIWFFWPSIKCVISVAAAYVMQETWVIQSFANHSLVQLFYS